MFRCCDRRLFVTTSFVLGIICVLGSTLFGQSGATVSGVVSDETGGVLPGVMVELLSRGSETVTITDER